MPYLILTLCAVVCTFFITRFFAVKTRLAEKAVDDMIGLKLKASPLIGELERLKEENGVMRNLLIDMIENEASVPPANVAVTEAERARAIIVARQRRREIFGEAIYVIRQAKESRNLSQSTHSDDTRYNAANRD
ncbi:hypothetical protein [Rhizobium miluonense]|uniref:Uncharacterized protein n=1 Tax=Rhizobium miluonense TaxID=411945 RepID=A0A1C3VMU9_9HYPH|nr:hypothetical protein [Rhizobium miluonense]SCB28905.1 hypothetical protein GA0061102_101538 [Rhizobium miluonense]